MDFKKFVACYPNFPKEGILFYDINSLLRTPDAFEAAIFEMMDHLNYDIVVAPEARGFIFGSAIASTLSLPFVPVRKPGKLPGKTIQQSYSLEYGEATLELPADAIQPGDKVIIIDDLLATGGTLQAIIQMIEKMGGEVVHISCLIELSNLKGRDTLKGYDISSVMTF
ncbi:MAG: adenine phosphoribosyltransferase [Clostridia bacterium]|nr:adenine phosphoribosyltransferase [Clostridia bacterium]